MRLILCLLALSFSLSATTYYVSNSGSDAANGTSTSTPWQTVAHVNAQTFSPGDSVLFQAGGIWRETLIPPSSGASGSSITFGSYGTGAQPIISAGNLAGSWTQGTGLPASETCTGSCEFASGFESGGTTFTDWTSHSSVDTSVTQSSAASAHGTYSLAVGPGVASGNRAYVQKTIPALVSGNTYYFRFYINIPSGAFAPSQTMKPFYLSASPGGTNIQMSLISNASGNLYQLSWYDTTHSFGVSNASVGNFTMGAWNYVDLAYTVSATTGGLQAWVNGVSVGSVAGKDSSGSAGYSNIVVGNNGFGSFLTVGDYFYIDDVQVSTAGPLGAFNAGGTFPTTVWRTAQATNPYYPNFAGAPGVQEASLGAVAASDEWYWDGSSYLYVYSAANPTSTVEIPARMNAITLAGKSYITLSGLDWRGAQADGLFINGAAGNLTLNGVTAELNYENGWKVLENSATLNNGVMVNSVLRYNGGSGQHINATHVANWSITGNQSFGNCQVTSNSDSSSNDLGDHQFCGGIHMFCSNTGGSGTVISGNVVHDNGVQGVSVNGQGNGIWPDTCTGVTITKNTVYNNTGHGVFLEKNVNSSMTYNLSYNNASIPFLANLSIKTSGEAAWKNATGNLMANNTSYGGYWGIFAGAYEGSGPALFQNNTIENNIAVGASDHDLWIDIAGNNDGTYGSGNVYQKNAFGPQATNFAYFCTTSGTGCSAGTLSTYSALDTAYGSTMNNVQSDPQLNNPGSLDFSLKSTSPARNAGIAISGYPFPYGAPDLGAIPFYAKGANTLAF